MKGIENFYYNLIKDRNTDDLTVKPEVAELKKEDTEEDISEVISREFMIRENVRIEIPPELEEVTPPEPMGLPPPPPIISKKSE